MYEELIKRLTACEDDCSRCPMMYDERVEQDLVREHCAAYEAADAIEELTAELEYTKRQYDLAVEDLEKIGWGEWIPVTERLPLLNTPVLATDGIEVDISWMYGVPPRWITSYTAIDEDKLTHWMPLPKIPQTNIPAEGHSPFYESLKIGLEQAINGENKSYTLVQALEDAGAKVKPGTGLNCNKQLLTNTLNRQRRERDERTTGKEKAVQSSLAVHRRVSEVDRP